MEKRTETFAEEMREQLGFPPDLIVRAVETSNREGVLLYLDGMVDGKELEDSFLLPMLRRNAPFENSFSGILGVVSYSGTLREIGEKECAKSLAKGNAIFACETLRLEIGAKKPTERSVSEPPTSSVIKGPREGFVESLKTNVVLLRKRLKTPELVLKEKMLGEKTNSRIVMAYIKGVADEKIAEDMEKKLSEVKIDGILDSSYISKILEDKPYSLFKQIGNSEKPDVITNKLLDGKIAVLCEGSPIALYAPFALIEDFEDVQDAYKRPLRATFLRYVRLLGAFLALLLPAAFVAVQVYQFQLLPVELLSTVINSTGKIPFSPMLEMLIALLLFEILGEASIRMPRHIGLALGVVGAIVLGETAVNAGILSSLTVLVVAMSGIGIYSVPDEAGTLSVLRVLFVVFSGLLGLIGLLFFGMAILAYLSNMSCFGIPYLLPVAPIFKEDLKDILIKRNLTDVKERFASFSLKNKKRLEE